MVSRKTKKHKSVDLWAAGEKSVKLKVQRAGNIEIAGFLRIFGKFWVCACKWGQKGV